MQMDYEKTRIKLLDYGCYLEHYEAWIGEPGEYKYILLGTQGLTLGYCKTLREAVEFLDKERCFFENEEGAYKTTQLTII